MPLVPLQALAVAIATGVGACLLAGGLTGRGRRRLLLAGAVVVAASLALAAIYVAFATAVTTWDERPQLAQGGALVLVAALMVLSIVFRTAHDRHARADGDEADDDAGGDGGQRRPTDPPPRRPPPAGPRAPVAPWDEFDAIRSGWDRVPAGRR
jgi:hypothetical protein